MGLLFRQLDSEVCPSSGGTVRGLERIILQLLLAPMSPVGVQWIRYSWCDVEALAHLSGVMNLIPGTNISFSAQKLIT